MGKSWFDGHRRMAGWNEPQRLRHVFLLPTLLLTACGVSPPFHPMTPQDVAAGSPLGPSYLLVPLPNEDDTLLGRVLLAPPENGRSLDEISRPNECGSKLTPRKEGPLASTFEDAQELAIGAKARVALSMFGFEGDAQTATHFYYKFDVDRRVSQLDTTDYTACCKEKGSCGYGFVSALVHGGGQYATARESNATGSVSIPVMGGAGGFVKATVLHKRDVRGYIAALITVTDPEAPSLVGVLGDPAAAGIQMPLLPDVVKQVYHADELSIDHVLSATSYIIRDGRGAAITEREFVRRYAKVTGADDLTELDRSRSKGMVAGGALVTVLGIAGASVGIWALATGASNETKAGGSLGAGLGGAAVIVGLITLGNGLGAASEGDTSDHLLSESDARLCLARYNRALLRKTLRDTQKVYRDDASFAPTEGAPLPRQRSGVWPVVSPTFTGIFGQF